MFSFLLSFIIDLYNLILITPNTNNAGMNIIFCKSKDININIVPFTCPKAYTLPAIVYPRQNPLNAIIPNTIGIPITVVPKEPYRDS